jgi:hypothetical protein
LLKVIKRKVYLEPYMTITNNVVAKASVALVALAMAVSLVAPKAQAADVSTMSLEQLIALVTQLQAQVGQNTSAISGMCDSIPAPLTIGSQGANVTALQNALLAAGQSIPAGATGYFGSQTQAALAAWQAANGVAPAVGYYGPITKAAMDAKCVPATPTTPTTPGGNDDDDEDEDFVLSGEASLGTTKLNDGDDTNLEEGQEAGPVAELEVEFDNGDAMITRMDLSFVATGSEADPWRTFQEISLWVDGEEVATKQVNRKSDWLSSSNGTLRFSGLNILAEEDEKVTIVIGVTVQNSVKQLPATWDVDVLNIRYYDGDGVTSTDTISVNSVDFTVKEAGSDDELIVKTSTEDPQATTIQVDTNKKSGWTPVFAFDLDTDDSVNDIELTTIPVTIVTSGNFNTIVSNLRLVIDGDQYSDWSYSGTHTGATTTTIVLFDIDGDHVIDAGDRVTAELEVEFKQLAVEGVTIQGIVTSANADAIDAEGADSLTTSQLSGAATGKTHTLRSSGAVLSFVSASQTKEANSNTTTTDDEGIFVIRFDVTAFKSDLFVNKSAASGTAMGTAGVNYRITDGSGNLAGTTTPAASLSSTADTDGTRFVVRQGETKRFTLTVRFDPGINAAGFYGLLLHSFNYATTNVDPTVQQRALPAATYETDPLSI